MPCAYARAYIDSNLHRTIHIRDLSAVARRSQMDALVGFSVGFWDYVTFVSLAVIGAAFIGVLVFILGLPGRIAIARNHPEAEAVYVMGWLGFLAVVPWIQAFMWAFKPTNIIDIRNLPKEEKRATDVMIARLKGEATTPDAGRPPNKGPPS